MAKECIGAVAYTKLIENSKKEKAMKKFLFLLLALVFLSADIVKAAELVLVDTDPRIPNKFKSRPSVYKPQAGDLLVFRSDKPCLNALTTVVTGSPVTHVALVVEFKGCPMVLSAEKGQGVVAESLPTYLRRGGFNACWVRRLNKPLSAEEKGRLEDWAFTQVGKPYAPIKEVLGTPCRFPIIRDVHGAISYQERVDQPCWFCSQLTFTGLQVAGLIRPELRASSVSPTLVARLPEDGPLRRPLQLVLR